MCFIDWKIGRLSRSVVHSDKLQTNGTVVIPKNQQRIAIYLPCDSQGTAFLWGINRTPAVNDYDLPSQAFGFFVFRLNQDGDLPMQSFTALSLGAPVFTLTWIEVVYPEHQLTLDLAKQQ